MNRRTLTKYLTTLPFIGSIKLPAETLSSVDDLKLPKNLFIEKITSVDGEYYDPNTGCYIYCASEQDLSSLQRFIDKVSKDPLFYRGTIYVDQHGSICNTVDFKPFKKFYYYPKNISPLWEVEYLTPYCYKTNRGLIGYFDRELEIFVRMEEYTRVQLYDKLLKMESDKGFFRGKIYTNGSNRFGILACYDYKFEQLTK